MEAPRSRRSRSQKCSVHLGGKVFLSLIAGRHGGPRRAGLCPEQVHVATGHQVLKRATEFVQLNRASLVGYLLQIENQVAVMILLRFSHAEPDWWPNLTQLAIVDRHLNEIGVELPDCDLTTPLLLLPRDGQLFTLVLEFPALQEQCHRDSKERDARKEYSYRRQGLPNILPTAEFLLVEAKE